MITLRLQAGKEACLFLWVRGYLGAFMLPQRGEGVTMGKRWRGRAVRGKGKVMPMAEIPAQGVTAFTAGQPVAPGPGIVAEGGAPRQFTFGSGYNIAQRPRSTELTPFEVLRQFAALYEGVQLCERVYLDILGRLELRVVARATGLVATDTTAHAIQDFLAMPDGERDLRGWLAAATRDLLEIDALAIYRHRRRDGRLYALELVDGSTIKPLIDNLGRRPAPPAPAYQQFVWGMAAGLYTRGELDYLCETPRTDSVYGVSRVERILYCVNQALRKQGFDLARYTERANVYL